MVCTVNENYRLKKMAGLVSGKQRVLDIGCSQYPNPFLQNSIVEGLDLVKASLPDNYSELHLGSMESLNSARYDGIVAGEILEHLERPIDFLRECYRLVSPGGSIVLSTPNPHSPIESALTLLLNRRFYYTSDHLILFPQRWLIRMLESVGFENVELYSGGFPLPPFGLIPCPRFFCYQTIARATRPNS